jgi:Tripartite tricarboxylate transporter family receptor
VRLAPTLTDLLAGHVDLSCTNLAGEQLKAGTLKGFGVASKDRFAPYPNLPSLVRSHGSHSLHQFRGRLCGSAGELPPAPEPSVGLVDRPRRAARIDNDPNVLVTSETTSELGGYWNNERACSVADSPKQRTRPPASG